MKKKQLSILSSIVVLLLAVLPQSCKKDDNKITNSYSYDGKVTYINYTSKTYNEQNNIYGFILSASTAAFDNDELFYVMYDGNKFGVTSYLSGSSAIYGVPSGGYFDDTVELSFLSSSDAVGDRADDITTATGNWVKVTKNGTSGDNFTIEFQMTLHGKLLKGSYRGDITTVIPN